MGSPLPWQPSSCCWSTDRFCLAPTWGPGGLGARGPAGKGAGTPTPKEDLGWCLLLRAPRAWGRQMISSEPLKKLFLGSKGKKLGLYGSEKWVGGGQLRMGD